MNRRFLVIALLMVLSAKPALAQSAPPASQNEDAVAAAIAAQLDREQALLNALAKEGALEKNVSGEIVVKQSLRDQLKQQNRVRQTTAKAGVVCE